MKGGGCGGLFLLPVDLSVYRWHLLKKLNQILWNKQLSESDILEQGLIHQLRAKFPFKVSKGQEASSLNVVACIVFDEELVGSLGPTANLLYGL